MLRRSDLRPPRECPTALRCEPRHAPFRSRDITHEHALAGEPRDERAVRADTEIDGGSVDIVGQCDGFAHPATVDARDAQRTVAHLVEERHVYSGRDERDCANGVRDPETLAIGAVDSMDSDAVHVIDRSFGERDNEARAGRRERAAGGNAACSDTSRTVLPSRERKLTPTWTPPRTRGHLSIRANAKPSPNVTARRHICMHTRSDERQRQFVSGCAGPETAPVASNGVAK